MIILVFQRIHYSVTVVRNYGNGISPDIYNCPKFNVYSNDLDKKKERERKGKSYNENDSHSHTNTQQPLLSLSFMVGMAICAVVNV